MSAVYTIDSEASAWTLIKQLAANEIKSDGLNINFATFPTVEVEFQGDHFRSTLPVRVMDAFKAIQSEVYRIYAIAAYDDEAYVLSREERDALELFFEISDGSTKARATNLPDVFETLGKKAIGKMDSKHIAVVLSIAAIGWTGIKIAEKVTEAQAKVAVEAERTKQDEEETKRIQSVAALAQQTTAVLKTLEAIEASTEAIAKSVKGSEKVILPDNEKTIVTEKTAKELFPKSKRRKPEDIRMDGEYTVKEVKNRDGEFRVTLQSDGKEYAASASLSNSSLCEELSKAVPLGTSVYLEINARDFEGEKKDLVILSMKPTAQLHASQ